jgi:DNA invertase Pin-like site-specific DNA recombinase
MPNRQPNLPELAQDTDGRIDHLVVCRESSIHGHVLMEGMIGQTVGSLLHLPGAADVLEAGISPLVGGSPFTTFQYRKNRTSAVVFEHQGVLYLYSLGSAASANQSETENAFVELLCELFEIYRPRNVYVATFNRLLRALEWSGRLFAACKKHVGVLHCGGTTIDPRTPAGKAMWSTFAMVADMERDSIVQRLFAGTVNKYLTGGWVLSPESVPPGYRLGDDGLVHLVADEVAAVRALLEMIANPTLTARQVIDTAGNLGLSSPTIRRIHGDDATFADICRADSRIASLLDWLPTYRTGQVDVFHKNPFPGVTQLRTLQVEGADTGPGHFRFSYQWDLPAGGWADDDVLTAAAARTTARKQRRTGGATHKARRPLAGWVSWQNDTHQFRLGGDSKNYLVFRRPLAGDEPTEAAS